MGENRLQLPRFEFDCTSEKEKRGPHPAGLLQPAVERDQPVASGGGGGVGGGWLGLIVVVCCSREVKLISAPLDPSYIIFLSAKLNKCRGRHTGRTGAHIDAKGQ